MEQCPNCKQFNTAWDNFDEIWRCLNCGIEFADQFDEYDNSSELAKIADLEDTVDKLQKELKKK